MLATVLSGTAAATTCQPVACSQILVDLPYTLDFSSDHGQIEDANGIGTGFTYIDPPSNGTGYIPANLAMNTASGLLALTTTAGSADKAKNSLDNALGVGIDAPSQVTRIETTIHDPPAGTGNFEQGGLWFGNDENNFVKLNTLSNSAGTVIEFAMEEGGAVVARHHSSVQNLVGKDLTLRLIADPTDRTIEALYQVDGGPFVSLGVLTAPGEFFSFDGARIDPEIGTDTFGGIYASHLNGPAPLTYNFDQFSVTKERDVSGTPADLLREGIAFTRTSISIPNPTSIVWGPDGRLYVSELLGTIHALTLDAANHVIADQPITTLGERLTLGLAVDPQSTPGNVILWVSNSDPSLNAGQANSGAVTRLSGPGFTQRTDVITGLPRAIANHATNSLHFGPDGKLYIAQGGNTAAGAPSGDSGEFGNREEQPLSAALLVADVRDPSFDGSCANPTDIYGPAPCDVHTYATGLRNTYDFVFHSNGSIYGPDNGVNTEGTFPPSPTPPCLGLADPAPWNGSPPGDGPGQQADSLNRLQQGKYYGHPDPHRDECVFHEGTFQGVSPLPNYVPPILSLGPSRSANGIIEYLSDAHCGSLKADLLISDYSVGDDITRVQLAPDGQSVLRKDVIASGFNEPLPLGQGPDGTIFVGEFTPGLVTALTPENIGCWAPRRQVPAEMLDAGGAALNGKLYVVAGEGQSGHLSTLWIYDPVANSWTAGPPLPGPAVENPAVTTDGGKLYVFGGSASGSFSGVNNAAVYDPSSNSWSQLPDMPTARGGATAQSLGGKLYVAGGLGSDGVSLSSVDVFDPSAGGSGSWSSAAPMATRRDNAGSAVLGGKLYVFGGGTRDAGGYTALTVTSVEMYDPSTDTWVPRADMPTGRRTMAVGTLEGRAQLIGGEPSTTPAGTFENNEEYNPATDSWRGLTSMPTPRHGAAAATINGVIYTAGGGTAKGTSFSAVNEAFSFEPLSAGPPPPPPPPPPPTAPKSSPTGQRAKALKKCHKKKKGKKRKKCIKRARKLPV